MTVCVHELQTVFDRQIVVRCHMDLVPLLLEHLQVWEMELADMAEYGGYIQYFHEFCSFQKLIKYQLVLCKHYILI